MRTKSASNGFLLLTFAASFIFAASSHSQPQPKNSRAKLAVMKDRLEETVTISLASAIGFHRLQEWDIASRNLDVAFESLATLSLDRILRGSSVYLVEELLRFSDPALTHEQLTSIIEEVYQKSSNGYSFSASNRDAFEASRELSVALDFISHANNNDNPVTLGRELESAVEIAAQLRQSENEFYSILGESVFDSLKSLTQVPAIEAESILGQSVSRDDVKLPELYSSLVRPSQHDFDFDRRNRHIKRQLRMLLTKRFKEVRTWLARVTYYVPEQRRIFDQYHLPKDLVFLAVIESGLNPRAYSHKAAKGMWQFIYRTGKLYGLNRDYWQEERYDPVRAGHAAARHLRDLHREFRSWELAIAAYNSGAGRVRSAVRRGRSKNFWRIRRYLPRETRDYVPIFYAMLMILKNPKKYGVHQIDHLAPIQYDLVKVPEATDLNALAMCAGTDLAELRHLNPSLRRNATPPDKDFTLRIPAGTAKAFYSNYAQLDRAQTTSQYATHQVRRGDSLYKIALMYGISYRELANMNQMGRKRTIYPGQVLKVPADSGPTRLARVGRDSDRYERVVYTVEAGDTLSEIAEYKFQTRASQLRRWNDLSYYDKIYPGQKLVVWVKK